ncbi:MAG: hypothetical protein HZC28_03915 [Spirochaetes bacterium]|nr:hypothetical protein [Spirochaetota bacterium]
MRPIFFFLITVGITSALFSGTIKHRFLAVDESRSQLHYIDENDPAKNWTFVLPAKYRDIQLIGSNTVLFSTSSGYRVYDLATRTMVKDVSDPMFNGCSSVRRRADGDTVIACNQNGITIFVVDETGDVEKQFAFPKLKNVRIMRLTPKNTALFGADNILCEASLADGTLLRTNVIASAKHIYHAVMKPDDNILSATGYGSFVAEIAPDGTVVKKFGGKPEPQGLSYHFFAGMQVLANGNIVVCNWTGHKPEDSSKSAQLIEFDTDGNVVWKWHDPVRAGTLHGVIVLDGVDTGVLNDDINYILGAVK